MLIWNGWNFLLNHLTKITYFDFSNIRFSSYFLNGFLELASEGQFQFNVSHEVPDELSDIEDEMRNYWLFRLGTRSEYALFRYHGKKDFLFCIDASDLNGDKATGGIQTVLLKRCKYYFKVNFNADAIANNPTTAPLAYKIKPVPVGRYCQMLWIDAESAASS